MAQHLSAHDLERFRGGRLSPSELLAADEHLAACAGCRSRSAEVVGAEAMIASLRSSIDADARAYADHITYEHLAAYVDDRLEDDERDFVESHFAVCQSCAAESADLRRFRRSLEARDDRAEPVVAKTAGEAFGSIINSRLADLRSSIHFTFAPRATAMVSLALAAATLIVAAILLSDRVNRSALETRTARTTNDDVPGRRAPEAQAANAQNASTQNTVPQGLSSSTAAVTSPADSGTSPERETAKASNEIVRRAPSSPPYARTSERVAASKSLRFPSILASLAGTTGVLRGVDDEQTDLALIYPLGEVARSERPTFRWKSSEGVTNYKVAVFDDKLNEIAVSPPLTTTVWTPPERLERGKIYLWQITAERDGESIIVPAPPAPEARFKVLDRSTSDKLERLRTTNRDDHLLLGTLYAEAGLLEDAESEFALLRRAAPRSELARKLAQSVAQRRRRPQPPVR